MLQLLNRLPQPQDLEHALKDIAATFGSPICDHPGCWAREVTPCGPQRRPLCVRHAQDYGYCYHCGGRARRFSRVGLCERCQVRLRRRVDLLRRRAALDDEWNWNERLEGGE